MIILQYYTFCYCTVAFPPKTDVDSDISKHRSECCLSRLYTLLPCRPIPVYWIRVGEKFCKKQCPYCFWNKQSVISSLLKDFPGNMNHYLDVPQVSQELCKARTSSVVQWLRLPSNAVSEVRSLAGELRSHMPCGQKLRT